MNNRYMLIGEPVLFLGSTTYNEVPERVPRRVISDLSYVGPFLLTPRG